MIQPDTAHRGNEKYSSDQCNTVSVEAHDSTENMQEKHQGNQICDDENLGRTFEAERRAVF